MSDSTARRWDAAYAAAAPPPWMIGQPQPEVAALVQRALLTGRLLDSGSGTGEHSLLAAAHGASVTGVDISPRAVETARRAAAARGVDVAFAVVDMLGEVPFPDAEFDTVLDSGVFHSFEGAEQRAYVANLTRVTRPGGRLHLICFSEHQPGDGEWGPRRITREEIREAFDEGWSVDEVVPAVYRINETHGTTRARAWRADIRRRPETRRG